VPPLKDGDFVRIRAERFDADAGPKWSLLEPPEGPGGGSRMFVYGQVQTAKWNVVMAKWLVKVYGWSEPWSVPDKLKEQWDKDGNNTRLSGRFAKDTKGLSYVYPVDFTNNHQMELEDLQKVSEDMVLLQAFGADTSSDEARRLPAVRGKKTRDAAAAAAAAGGEKKRTRAEAAATEAGEEKATRSKVAKAVMGGTQPGAKAGDKKTSSKKKKKTWRPNQTKENEAQKQQHETCIMEQWEHGDDGEFVPAAVVIGLVGPPAVSERELQGKVLETAHGL
jgi:hypothetical protein